MVGLEERPETPPSGSWLFPSLFLMTPVTVGLRVGEHMFSLALFLSFSCGLCPDALPFRCGGTRRRPFRSSVQALLGEALRLLYPREPEGAEPSVPWFILAKDEERVEGLTTDFSSFKTDGLRAAFCVAEYVAKTVEESNFEPELH